ncbi:nuclear transport factor 2 family protein [Fortiea contorta]|uniref:nuclear transport factor 2 family protein n=1 Tax=Fortiea contorta TaxID=1892405 RepID=UPI000373C9A0|nr:nuclear transport factor 2 family protein [Fortiea contorta]
MSTVSTQAIATLIAEYFAATRVMDVEAWLETFAEDAIDYDPVGGNVLKGHREIGQFFLSVTDMFATVGLTEEFVHIVGNEVAVKWTGRGTGKNGQEVIFEGIDLFEINAAGKIQTLRAYWNADAAIAKLQENRVSTQL